jgi:hypothetical protein
LHSTGSSLSESVVDEESAPVGPAVVTGLVAVGVSVMLLGDVGCADVIGCSVSKPVVVSAALSESASLADSGLFVESPQPRSTSAAKRPLEST